MSNNLGSFFVIALFSFFGYIITFILVAFKRIPFLNKINRILKKKLYWNFAIRLVIEGVLELFFSVYFNLKYGVCNFNIYGSWVNYFFAVFFAAIILLSPILVLVFYCKNFHKLKEEEFESKFGSVYEGINVEKRSALVFTSYFLIRRAIFSITSLLLFNYPIVQL